MASVYWHVDNKDELLELCFQATLEPVARDVLGRKIGGAGWQAGLRGMLADLFEAMQDHPWVAELSTGPQSPQSQGDIVTRIWDWLGAILEEAGLDEKTNFYATSTLAGHLGSMGLVAARSAYRTDGHESREQRLA